ncbi:MAG: hypothetical protein ACJAT7_001891 [Psychromonas sp.]|jgi:hypothetical protein
MQSDTTYRTHTSITYKAVLLRSECWEVVIIAKGLRIDESTITHHINDFLYWGNDKSLQD